MNIMFLIPSKLDGPSARYILDLIDSLNNVGVDSIVSSEDDEGYVNREFGESVFNLKMPSLNDLDGFHSYLHDVKQRNIDFVFSVGSRIKIDLISLHLKRSGVGYIKQFEDDEETIFLNCNKGAHSEEYTSLLEAGVNVDFHNLDINELHNTKYKVVDPYIKGVTLSLLNGYTKIWGGLSYIEENYLTKLNFISLPPICSKPEIDRLLKSVNESKNNNCFLNYFIGGSIYSKEDADIFLSAWKEFKNISDDCRLTISFSRTSKNLIEYLLKNYNGKNGVSVIDLPTDVEYLNVLSNSQYVLSIGGGKFDERRLPSRLVKSMFLGKTILLPSVGFGTALENNKNAFVCANNTKKDWLDTLIASYKDREDNLVGRKASNFAFNNFDVMQVTGNFIKLLENINYKNITSNTAEIPLEHCMMADFISLTNASDNAADRPPIQRIKYRFVHVGTSLFIQTIDRYDYNWQVDCAVSALANGSEEIQDTGFKYLKRYEEVKIFNESFNSLVGAHEILMLLKIFRDKFVDFNDNARSLLFDKLLLSYRLYKVVDFIVEKYQLKNVFFHADMQSTEALISSFLHSRNKEVKTISLQHAIFYDTKDKYDVNLVNTRVSPSRFGFFWDENVSGLIKKYNPSKVVQVIHPVPCRLLKNIDVKSQRRPLLVILDGPNHGLYNKELLVLCDSLVERSYLKSYDIKAHPYYNKTDIDCFMKVAGRNFVEDIKFVYEKVFFISSTLGYEMYNSGFSVYQYMPEKFSDDKTAFHFPGIKRFYSSASFDGLFSKSSDFIGDLSFSYSLEKEKYVSSFRKAVDLLL
ncbi:hypothetical protein OW491_15715 [Neptunomonas sp. CHC150]|uniref:hypothetical protein n=1 Tax=Neptunomonas sp. CHC150 TaxID=2998324 RepID=UPI0025AF276F|nr:hypothetical protein [Neptunomonas sp. CHC150]MDN2661259.1 hypothetical protein [Neptunomonas sp. CHC150]